MTIIDHKAFENEASALRRKCVSCKEGRELPFSFTMAFQPIVDLITERPWGYEALVWGEGGEAAAAILDQVDEDTRYAFDQACRVKAIELAADLIPSDGTTKLSINFKPNAVYEPSACIRTTLATASRVGFDLRQLMFEFTEEERMQDVRHVRRIVDAYQKLGFITAIDDFGAGRSGLTLLADLLPDLIKLDMGLIRDIDSSKPRQLIVRSIVELTQALDIMCIAEGLETLAEVEMVRELGIELCQGFYFAKPSLNVLPEITTQFDC